MRRLWCLLFFLPSTLSAVTPDKYKIIVGPEGRVQFVHRLSSTSAGMLLDIATSPAQNGDVLAYNSSSGNFSPASRLQSTFTAVGSWTFFSSVTVTLGTVSINGQAYVHPSSASAVGQHLSIGAITGGYTYLIWGGDSAGGAGGGGGGSTLFLEPAGVSVSTMFFPPGDFVFINGTGISTVTIKNSSGPWSAAQDFRGSSTTFSSGTFINLLSGSSITAITIFVSSNGALFGGSTVQALELGVGIVGAPSLTFGNASRTTGFYQDGTDIVGFTWQGARTLDISNALIMSSGKQIQAANGTVGSPAISWSNLTTSGLYIEPTTPANMGISMGGVELMKFWRGVPTQISIGAITPSAGVHISTLATNQPVVNFSSETIKFQINGSSSWINTPLYISSPVFLSNIGGVSQSTGFAGGQLVMGGSATIRGIYVSSAGFQVAASTIQGVFLVEGGTFQFRNGTNEFSIVFATGGYSVGDRLIITQVTGSRMMIAGGKPSVEAGGTGGSDNLGSHISTRPLVLSGGFSVITGSNVVIGTQPFNNALVSISTTPNTTRPLMMIGTGTAEYELYASSFVVNVTTSYFNGTLVVDALPADQGGLPSIISGNLQVKSGSMTVIGGGGVDAASFTVRNVPVVSSTWSFTNYAGFVIAVATGSIPSNTTRTFTASQFGFSSLGIPMCMLMQGGAAPTLPIFLQDAQITTSQFQLTNPDLTNIQKFSCWVPGRPN